jgi:hypothetical protein
VAAFAGVLLAAGCASSTRPAGAPSPTAGTPDGCLPAAWRTALADATIPLPGAGEPIAIVPDGRVVVRIAGRPGLALASANSALQQLAVPDVPADTDVEASVDAVGGLLVTYRPGRPVAVATTHAPTGTSATPRVVASPPEAVSAWRVDLATGQVQRAAPPAREAHPTAQASVAYPGVVTPHVDVVAGPFVFFHDYDVSDAIRVLDTRTGSAALTGLQFTGLTRSGYGVVAFGGALATTSGPPPLRVIDTRDLPRIEC